MFSPISSYPCGGITLAGYYGFRKYCVLGDPDALTAEEAAVVMDLGLLCLCYAQSCGIRRAQAVSRNFWLRNRYVRLYASMLVPKVEGSTPTSRGHRRLLRNIVDLVQARMVNEYRYSKSAVGRPPLELADEYRAIRALVR